LRVARSFSRRCATRARLGPGRGRVGPRGVYGHQLQGVSERSDLANASWVNRGKGDKGSTH
jgi:hypothetical protein